MGLPEVVIKMRRDGDVEIPHSVTIDGIMLPAIKAVVPHIHVLQPAEVSLTITAGKLKIIPADKE